MEQIHAQKSELNTESKSIFEPDQLSQSANSDEKRTTSLQMMELQEVVDEFYKEFQIPRKVKAKKLKMNS